jgi:hypothetical protein
MDHTLEFLRTPPAGLDLPDVMIRFVTDLRRILIQMELRPDLKLAAIEQRVNELAPPPRADGSTGPL